MNCIQDDVEQLVVLIQLLVLCAVDTQLCFMEKSILFHLFCFSILVSCIFTLPNCKLN